MSNTGQAQPQTQPQDETGANQTQLDPNAGRGISITGFILAFIPPLSMFAMILAILGLIQSRQGGGKANRFAIAGIVISFISPVIFIVLLSAS